MLLLICLQSIKRQMNKSQLSSPSTPIPSVRCHQLVFIWCVPDSILITFSSILLSTWPQNSKDFASEYLWTPSTSTIISNLNYCNSRSIGLSCPDGLPPTMPHTLAKISNFSKIQIWAQLHAHLKSFRGSPSPAGYMTCRTLHDPILLLLYLLPFLLLYPLPPSNTLCSDNNNLLLMNM